MSTFRPTKQVLLLMFFAASLLLSTVLVPLSMSAEAHYLLDEEAAPASVDTVVPPSATLAPEQAYPPATKEDPAPRSEDAAAEPTNSSATKPWTPESEPGVVPTPTAALAAAMAEAPASMRVPRRLRLAALCSDDPSSYRMWRVSNPNDMAVPFSWTVMGTSQTGQLVVAAKGEVLFQTGTVAGPNTTSITVNRSPHDIKISTRNQCPTVKAPATQTLRRLRLVPLCSDEPRSYRLWQVRNPNDVAMTFAWVTANGQQQGEGTVPANGAATFQTNTVTAANTTRILVDGILHASRASIPVRCLVPRRTAALAEAGASQPARDEATATVSSKRNLVPDGWARPLSDSTIKTIAQAAPPPIATPPGGGRTRRPPPTGDPFGGPRRRTPPPTRDPGQRTPPPFRTPTGGTVPRTPPPTPTSGTVPRTPPPTPTSGTVPRTPRPTRTPIQTRTPDPQIPGWLRGYKFNDLDGDGIWDRNETGLGGVSIVVRSETGQVVASTVTTNASGSMSGLWEVRLLPGIYTIEETAPPGYMQTYPETAEGVYRIAFRRDGSYRLLSDRPRWYTGLNFGNTSSSDCHVCPKYVVFQSDRGGLTPNVIRTRFNGLWGVPLTKIGANISPVYNFQASQIAFASNRDGNWEIYRMNGDGNGQTNVTNNSESADLSPSWECSWIAFQSDRDGNWEIYKTDPSGSEQIRLTNNPASDADPAWAPDSQRIAFASDRDGNWDLYVMDQDGQNVQQLTDNPATDRNPAWSIDGQFIAFESDRDGQFEIYKLNLASGEVTRLTTISGGNLSPAWMPYCGYVFFQSERDGNLEIYRMLEDGTKQTNIRRKPSAADAFDLLR